MQPNPLFMLMKNMTQRPHGPRPYDGILGASQEKVVAYEGGTCGDEECEGACGIGCAIEQARHWIDTSGTYHDGDRGTLIEIRVVHELDA